MFGLSESHVHVFVADVVKSFDTVDRGVLDLVLGRLGLPVWFRRVILVIMLMFGLGSSLLVVLVRLAFLRVVRIAWFSSWPFTFLGAGLWSGLRLDNLGAILSLLDGLLGFMSFGVAFGCCVGTWRIILQCMSFPGSIVFYGLSLLGCF